VAPHLKETPQQSRLLTPPALGGKLANVPDGLGRNVGRMKLFEQLGREEQKAKFAQWRFWSELADSKGGGLLLLKVKGNKEWVGGFVWGQDSTSLNKQGTLRGSEDAPKKSFDIGALFEMPIVKQGKVKIITVCCCGACAMLMCNSVF